MSRKFPRPLIGLLLTLLLASAKTSVAQETRHEAALDLVPAKPLGMVSIRVGELARKLDVKSDDFPVVAWFENVLGMRLTDIERVTQVATDSDGTGYIVIQTKRNIDRKACKKLCEARSVEFIGDRTVVVADSPELVKDCLKLQNGDFSRDQQVKELLEAAPRHDIVAWVGGRGKAKRHYPCYSEGYGAPVRVSGYEPADEEPSDASPFDDTPLQWFGI